jgi:hypothetical protein
MTIPRQQIVHPDVTRYYHCISRCVRRSFLCGLDRLTNQNFDHRKTWLVERMKLLGRAFAVDICAYAVMSNHYHLVLHMRYEAARTWTDREVVERWCMLFNNPLGRAYLDNQPLLPRLAERLTRQIEKWRERLTDISWYMRCLNETIAREANREDDCSGRFWEGRFKCQALLDESTVLGCMAYVDLNPVRSGLCESMEEADFTSIQERIRAFKAGDDTAADLMPFTQPQTASTPHDTPDTPGPAIPFTLDDYFALVDWTGRAVRDDKRGAIPAHVPKLLAELGLEQEDWVVQVQRFGRDRRLKIGREVRQIGLTG